MQQMQIQQSIKAEWEAQQQKRPTTTHGAEANPSLKVKPAATYTNISNRKHIAWIARLRTGNCSLNKYLHLFNIIDNPMCKCGRGQETVAHYLLTCERFKETRNKLREMVGVAGMRVEILLGDPTAVKATIEYVQDTNRFEF